MPSSYYCDIEVTREVDTLKRGRVSQHFLLLGVSASLGTKLKAARSEITSQKMLVV